MKYFVRIDKTVIVVNSEDKAKEVAETYVSEPDVKYIDYGIVNFDNWEGNTVLVVVKNEPDEEVKNGHSTTC